MKINKKSILYILVLIFPLFLSNCSLWQKRVNLEQITINVEPGANDNAPIAIDMVAAADDVTLAMLQGMSASQWFNAKQQLQRDYPETIQVWSLELVPGSRFQTEHIPLRGAPAEGVLLFAHYQSEGEHRLRLDNPDTLNLLLMADDLTLTGEQGR